jgi:ABC-type multidrug transport system ATPase subunit
MKLTLNSTAQSISKLTANDLPNFSIVTGPNGSGKTHLLRGIENGSIFVDGAAKNIGGRARFFDANSIVPTSTGTFSSQTLRTLRTNTVSQLGNYQTHVRNELTQNIQGLLQNIRQTDPTFSVNDALDLVPKAEAFNLNPPELRPHHLQPLYDHVNALVTSKINDQFLQQFGISRGLAKYASERKVSLLKLTAEDLATEAIDLWGGVNVFQQNLGQLFVAYRDMKLANSLRENHQKKSQVVTSKVYTDEEFVVHYGQSPWDFVNEILSRARLPFKVNAPDEFSYDDFTPLLTKDATGVKVAFENLSSGEKVLMSFALCLYQARDGRQAIDYPEILLLDEIDAPLHPSMVKDLIATIKDVLVADKNIKVILTTHSPTTVAIAPEESVFVMRDSTTLFKTPKEDALRLLTFGVPTLSISFDARRQVFVESRKDAEIYDELYGQLRQKISSEKSLVFIAVSGASKSIPVTDENGGSSVVKKLVGQLKEAGNSSIYGLIDWDTKSSSSERVIVLAQGSRYSLDNCILDPCLLALLVVNENIGWAREKCLVTKGETYLTLAQSPKARMQVLVDTLLELLEYRGEKVECGYSGGERLQLPKSFLRNNGHTHEAIVLEKLRFLQSIGTLDKIKNRIVRSIASDAQAWLPIELQEAFEALVKLG